jgi:hypothetical protein
MHMVNNASAKCQWRVSCGRARRIICGCSFTVTSLPLRYVCALVCRDRGQLPPGPRIHDPYALPDARVATLDMQGLVPTAPGLDVHSQEPTAPHLAADIVAPANDVSDRDIPPRHGALPTASPVDAFPSARYEAALESLRAASTVEEVGAALEACRALLLLWGDSHRRWVEMHWTLMCACLWMRAMCAIECVVCLSDCLRPEGVLLVP